VVGWGSTESRLVGEPTPCAGRIKLGTFAALDQRITLRYAMAGMTGDETTSYRTT